MTLGEFIAGLDPTNPCYEDFVEQFRLNERWMKFERKDKDLVEKVASLCKERAAPIIDKRLRVVIGMWGGNHEIYRTLLWTYHTRKYESVLDVPERIDPAYQYLKDGMGYYISSMNRRKLIVAYQYRPDRFDKDLFELYEVGYC